MLISELPLIGFYYRLTEMLASVDEHRSVELYKHLYDQSITSWPLPEPPSSTVTLKVDLLNTGVSEEMAICLPENLLRGLSKSQLDARKVQALNQQKAKESTANSDVNVANAVTPEGSTETTSKAHSSAEATKQSDD